MILLFDSLLITKYFSYLVPIVIFYKNRIELNEFKSLNTFLFISLILSLVERLVCLQFESAISIFHLSIPIRFFYMYRIFLLEKSIKRLRYYPALISLIIFLFETIICNGWLKNNEIQTVYVNICTAVISVIILMNHLKTNDQKEVLYKFLIYGSFLFVSASSLILSLYESEIRQSPSMMAFFMIVIYNSVEIVQNLSIAFSLWKLKEA